MPQDYNATLNLPKTDFPMRAALPKREPDMLKSWDELDLYHKIVERNEGKPRFILHDGPPFSNGYIHMGTAMNKCIKDFIVRYKNMTGYQAPYVPGWDNHGMPIESAIIKQNKLDRKSMSIPEFRDACAEFAEKFVDIQREQFMRLGVIGEWFEPYLTMTPRFEAEEVKVFGDMYNKGYIYKGKKPVYWCPHDETALAEAEIEYANQNVETLYVKFPVSDDKGLFAPHCGGVNPSFVIWTTTTWTIPGNMAICLGAEFEYVLAKASNGEIYVMAKDLLEDVGKTAGIDNFQILAEFKGSELEFMKAKHPLYDRESIIIVGEHVTLEAGTGCVHTAPGHGMEDFDICMRYNNSGRASIPIIVPVDDRGHMNAESGKYDGMYYAKANKAIQADLAEGGFLLSSESIDHQYAHCWRCKNPILYRATDQWFCSVDAIKKEAVEACHGVKWFPEWGHDRMTSMIEDRSDWCISRQRHWGLPIPVLYCKDCGEPICTPETIKQISDIFKEKGSNAWFSMEPLELVPADTKCSKCGSNSFFKLNDTLDGWFDSGSTHIASMELDNPSDWPADMYLEGADQYRGWFQSSLLVGVAVKGGAPYRQVLTHGWTVDGDGKQMHKSLGNGVYPEDIIPKFGADVLRLWAASADYHNDVRCSDAIFKQLSDAYLKIRNTARFILGNLEGFDADDMVKFQDMLPEDKWALVALNKLIEKVTAGYEKYEFHTVVHAIHNFCVTQMSSFYLDVIKDRMYCEAKNSLERRSGQSAMYTVLHGMVLMLAPILSFTSNEIWLAMPHSKDDDARHVMLNDIPKVNAAWTLPEGQDEFWSLTLKLRDDVNKALELSRAQKLIGKPLEAKVTIFVSDDARERFNKLLGQRFAPMFIVSEVEIVNGAGEGYEGIEFPGVTIKVENSTLPKCVRCWTHTSTVGENSQHPELCARCAGAVQ